MRIVAASDTHTKHDGLTVPAGDVFVHCGDFSGKGTLDDVRHFGEWLRTLPHKHKVVVAGNHDFAMQRLPDVARALLGMSTIYSSRCRRGIVYLFRRHWASATEPKPTSQTLRPQFF